MDDTTARRYPHGVPCWVDTDQPDLEAGLVFYAGLFGWTFTEVTPPQSPSRYLVAQLAGRDVAAVTGPKAPADATPGGAPDRTAAWRSYVAVDDVDVTTARLAGAGATVLDAPADAGPGGRTATLTDPEGVEVRLWQARRRLGAQTVNEPGAWNFSDLHSADPVAATAFYGEAFGWRFDAADGPSAIRVPGYGDHLEATVDPDIRARQAAAPEGFADVVGAVLGVAEGEPAHWHVTFTVADRDASVRSVRALGGQVVAAEDSLWARTAVVRDPQGALLTLSQFTPSSG